MSTRSPVGNRKRTAVTLACFALIAPMPASCAERNGSALEQRSVSRGRLLFEDRFDGNHLDGQRWNTCHWWGPDGCTISTNNELEWYVPQQVAVRAGTLRLTVSRNRTVGSDGRTYAYRSGMVTTGRTADSTPAAKFAYRYGYLEVRARIPRGAGLWPALWLLPTTNESLPEIDLAEVRGSRADTISMHLHWRDPAGRAKQRGARTTVSSTAEGWHVFALDWQRGSLRWLVDGVERWRVQGSEVPSEPMYVIANLAIGGDWAGPPTAETPLPATFEIDRVTVWAS